MAFNSTANFIEKSWALLNNPFLFFDLLEPWQIGLILFFMYFQFVMVTQRMRRKKSAAGNGMKVNVEAQSEAANKKGSWHNMVLNEDRAGIMKLVKNNPAAIHSRGPVGETICHFLLMCSGDIRTEICKDLLEMFPDAINDVYDQEPYAGENLLHVAIVHRNVDMVRWLVQRQPELMQGAAHGSFFNKKGMFYFGEYPLSFAVCSNQANVVEYLLAQGADLLAADVNGNTAIHMCVWWKLKEMYAFLEELNQKKHFCDDLSMVRNTISKGGLTCLTLAAFRGDTDMFDWILERKQILQWSYGPVRSYLVPLEEIDWIRGHEMGAIEWMVDLGHKEFLQSKRVQSLINLKWERFAEKVFYERLERSVFFMLGFTFLVVFDKGVYGSFGEMLFVAAVELILVVGAGVKLKEEIKEVQVEGLETYLLPRVLVENVCSFVACFGFVTLFISRHTIQWVWYEGMARVAISIFGWSYMIFFLLGSKRTGHFVVMIYKMIKKDVLPFSVFTSVFLGMFAMLFFLIFEEDRDMASFTKHLMRCFEGIIGNINVKGLDATATDAAREELVMKDAISNNMPQVFVVMFAIMCIVLLNLLVAMMNDTYSTINAEADLEWQLQRASIIFSIEQNMSDAELESAAHKYWVDVDGKRYLQIVEENPGAFDEFITDDVLEKKRVDALAKERMEHVDHAWREKLAEQEQHERKRVASRLGDIVGKWKQHAKESTSTDSNSTSGAAKENGAAHGSDVDHLETLFRSVHDIQIALEAKFFVLSENLTKLVVDECAGIRDSLQMSGAGDRTADFRRGSEASAGARSSQQWTSSGGGTNVDQLSAKLDLFASTTSDLMRKNAELEVQLNAMRVQMENTSGSRNRFQSVARMAIKGLPAPPAASSSLLDDSK
eukprot:m.1485944 g.1485944  ORF g.1485944 m.1485944 type:complete len:891 (-) comp25182_c0_seq28:4458-7130(-)